MGSVYRFIEMATSPALKIAFGVGGIVAVVSAYLGLIDQQTAATYIYLYLSYLGINMGNSERKARKLEREAMI